MEKEIKELIDQCEKEYDLFCDSLMKLTDKLEVNLNLTDKEVDSIYHKFKVIEVGIKQNRDKLYDYYDRLSRIKEKNALNSLGEKSFKNLY